MTPQINLVHDHIGPSLQEYSEVMGRTLADTMKRAAKGVTRRVINLTPPAHEGVTGAAAYRYGRRKIKRDMERVLAPVKLKGHRLITKVFGQELRRPIRIATAEKYPDVVSVYRQHRKFRNVGVGARSTNLRDRKYYVDQAKFNRLLKTKEARVGLMASGWAEGAAALDVPLQNWIARHGRGRGAVKQDLVTSRMRITVINHPPPGLPANVEVELQRRIKYAVQYQRDAMAREVKYYAMKKAQEAGMKTRNFDALVPAGMSGRSDT
jgi:hypothetical protein